MGKNNFELLKIAQKHLGQGGAVFRRFCGLPNGAAWCNAFVCYVANEGGDSSLYFNGSKMTYCPTSMKWCRNNLAQIPIYLAMPMDIIYFDWEPNGVPNHIGFVRERKSDLEVYTIEGNTSGGIVAQKTRTEKYVCGCFRPHFKPTGIDANKKLVVDSYFGYHSIVVMQRWLGVAQDAILGVGTVKALQKRLGVSQDGSWGKGTTRALQKFLGISQDGYCGPATVRAFQTYLNKAVFGSSPSVTTSTAADKAVAWAKKIAADDTFKYVAQTKSDSPANHCAICKKVASGSKYHGFNCIRFVGAAYYHGAGVPIKSADHKLVTTDMANKMLRASTIASALKLWTDRNGSGWALIKNGNKKLPVSMLKKGDVLICYDKEGSSATYKHMAIYDGDGMISDAANASAGIVTRKYTDLSRKCLIAMRYTK